MCQYITTARIGNICLKPISNNSHPKRKGLKNDYHFNLKWTFLFICLFGYFLELFRTIEKHFDAKTESNLTKKLLSS